MSPGGLVLPGRGDAALTLPETLAIDAWTGSEGAAGAVDPQGRRWGARTEGLPASQAALPFAAPVDPTRWADPEVGYAVLLPQPSDPQWSVADLAAAADAEQPVRDLLAARPGSVVLRWLPELGDRFLRRNFADGTSQDAALGLSAFGVAKGRLPRYIAIIATPDQIPWSTQYALAVRHAVGRIPLAGAELANYVGALISDWPEATLDVAAPVVWTVDLGGGDITSLMRATITDPLVAAMTGTLRRLTALGSGAAPTTGTALLEALARSRPALVVTSSHGQTGPLDDLAKMGARLGLPVDSQFAVLELDALDAAMPAGSVWFAQACCSAGSDATSHYDGLVKEGTVVADTLTGIAALGARVAPAPLRLLGRPNPVRAVLGHVEPTFDWTLRVLATGQQLGSDIVTGLTSNAFNGQPMGYAFSEYRAGVGVLHTRWADRRAALDDGDASVRPELTWLRLTALDRQALVLLGDPTVTLPPRAR